MLAGDNESYICARRTSGEVLQKLSIFSSRMSTEKKKTDRFYSKLIKPILSNYEAENEHSMSLSMPRDECGEAFTATATTKRSSSTLKWDR